MLRVIAKHRDAAYDIDRSLIEDEGLSHAATAAWDEALELGEQHGYRNAQATVLAPTGTIAFMMDCDTTGVEPDIALVKYKKLVGGGMLRIVNHTVPRALARLGYSEEQVRGHRRLHRRRGHDRGRARPQGRAPARLRLRLPRREGRALDRPHGPRAR
jgi:ribonucleoside-diphosphate reductase alpha chain